MSEMVERVARVIEALPSGVMGMPIGFTDYAAIARAIVAAMREPTEAMLNAARDWSRENYGKPIGNDAAIGCWQVMIDASENRP